MAALVLIGLPVVLLCLGVPIFVALIAAASIGIVTMNIGSMAPVHVAQDRIIRTVVGLRPHRPSGRRRRAPLGI